MSGTLSITFECHPDGGEPFTVVARSRAITRWERSGKGGKSFAEDGRSITTLVDVAWYAAEAAGLTELDIRQWREQVDVDPISEDEDDDEPDPTRTAR